MNKQTFKQQQRYCAITGAHLSGDPSLSDTDRIIERCEGGTYTKENTRVITPRAHMERHGILREREEWLEQLKAIMDDRQQTMKVVTKMNNQLLAYQRQTDHARESTVEFLKDTLEASQKRLAQIDREATKHVKASTDPLVQAAMGVPGVGPVTVAGLQTYVDLAGVFPETFIDEKGKEKPHPRAGQEKARSASALWAYVGLDKPFHSRYEKGKASGGNKTLRTMVWNMANSMTKNRNCPYREVYDRTKERLAASEKVTKTRTTQGHLVECAWKDTKPSHRHGAALRAVMKHFLADYWFVGRELAGLDTRPLYVEEQLGHTSIIRPRERGWEW